MGSPVAANASTQWYSVYSISNGFSVSAVVHRSTFSMVTLRLVDCSTIYNSLVQHSRLPRLVLRIHAEQFTTICDLLASVAMRLTDDRRTAQVSAYGRLTVTVGRPNSAQYKIQRDAPRMSLPG